MTARSAWIGVATMSEALIGPALPLRVMIAPPFAGASPAIGVWEIGSVALLIGAFGLAAAAALRRAPLVPSNDPLFAESLHYHA